MPLLPGARRSLLSALVLFTIPSSLHAQGAPAEAAAEPLSRTLAFRASVGDATAYAPVPAVGGAAGVTAGERSSDKSATSAPAASADTARPASALPEAPSAAWPATAAGAAAEGDSPAAAQADGARQQITGLVPPQDPTVGRTPPVAPLRWKYIPAGYTFHHLSQGDKVYIAFRDLYSPLDLGAVFLSAGLSHVRDSSPKYGTDRGAFGERLGAAGLREASQGIFVDAVFAPLFHQDPRFFGEGPNHNATHRTFHALSRVLITRNDNGTHGPNLSLWAGHAAAAALTPLYYPPVNRNANDVASSFGFSLLSAGLGFIIDEYVDDVLQAVHFEKKP